jgi:hypothetical protein
MAVPTYTTDLITLDSGEGTTPVELTGWAAGAPSAATETDYYIQGSGCKSSSVKTTQNSMALTVTSFSVPSGGAVLFWQVLFAPNSLGTFAQGGQRCVLGNSTTNFNMWYSGGSDTPPNNYYGGWKNIAIDPTVATDATGGTGATSPFTVIGLACYLPTTYPSKGVPFGMDAIRYGRGELSTTGGSSGSGYATFTAASTQNDNQTNRWGLLIGEGGGSYTWKGMFRFGKSNVTTTNRARATNVATITTNTAHGLNVGDTIVVSGLGGSSYNGTWVVTVVGSTTTFSYANPGTTEGTTADTGGTVGAPVEFVDSNKVVFVDDTPRVASGFNKIDIRNSASVVYWTNVIFAALGTTSRGSFEMIDNADVQFNGCLFKDMNTFIFSSAAQVLNCNFVNCNLITGGGGVFTGTNILTPTVAADASGFDWNNSGDPDGNLDDMVFSKGTNAHHAINFGTSAPTTMTLRGISFSGFNANDAQNDSTLYFSDKGTNTTWTINLVGCSGNISYKKARAGDTINLVIDPVTLLVTVTDIETGDPILGARVLLEVGDSANYPYQDPISMTGTGTTVTVVHSGHGMATNDYVVTLGATNDDDYNGVHQITVSGVDSYTFISDETITSSPATGTLTATFAPISGETDINGEISDSRSYGSPQPIVGWVRKGSSQPYYKQQPISDTISNTAGLSLNVQLIGDE